MKLTNKDLQIEYKQCNKIYFDNELPKDLVVEFVPSSELDGDWGEYEDGEIHINEKLKTVPDFAFIVLRHEMAHVKVPQSPHGFQFGAVINQLWQKGAYDDLI